MRKFFSICMMLVFAVATVIPATPHAEMVKDSTHNVRASDTSDHGDCHHGDSAKTSSAKTEQNNKNTGGKCCEQGPCTCTLHACHGSVVSILGNNEIMLYGLYASKGSFVFADDNIDSALSERLKRPPKA